MGGFAARKSKLILDNMAQILGVELLMALDAVDILQMQPSKRLMEVKRRVREEVAEMEFDKFYG